MVAAAVADVAAQTPTITLSVSPSSVGEDDGSADVTVTATLAASRTVATVVTLSAAGMAIDPDDYEVLGSLPSITIQSGQTTSTAQVVVSLVDDTLYEGDESIELNGNSSGADVVPASITVQDDETQPTITLTRGNFVTLSEASPADTDSTMVTATVLGGSTFSRDTTFTFDFSLGSATKGDDFTVSPDPYTVTIPAGATVGTGSATFSVLDDNIFEGFQPIDAVASGTDHLGNALAFTYPHAPYIFLFMGQIRDDETEPTIRFSTPTQTTLHEGDPPQTKTLQVALSVPATSDLTVSLSVTAFLGGADRFSASLSARTILIATGQSTGTATLTVTPMDDGVAQTSATLVNVRASASGYHSTTYAFFLIEDNLTQLFVTGVALSPQRVILLEGDRLEAYVDLNVSGADMVGTPTVPVRIGGSLRDLPCQFQGTRALSCRYVVAAGDYAPDGVELLDSLSVDGVTFRNRANSETIPFDPTIPVGSRGIQPVIIHGGQMWSFDLSTSLESVQEGVGERPVTVTATIAQGPVPQTDVVLPLAVVDATTSPRDYAVTGPLEITIPRGAVAGSTTLNVTALEDGVKENRRETLRFARGDTPYYATPVDFAIIDSPSVQLSVSPGSVTENGGARTVTVTAELGDPTDQVRPRPIAVAVRLGGTAVEGDDFALSGGRVVTIAANARAGSATLTLTPTDDRLLEMDETIELHGSTPGLTVSGTELTLVDDEVQPQVVLSVDADTLLESDTGGKSVQVTATLDPSVMVSAAVVTTLDLGGSATEGAGGDYTASWSPSARQITIAAMTDTGSAAVTLTLAALQDDLAEGDETIVVEGVADVQNPAMDDLSVQVATIVLQDDDVRGVVVSPTRLTIDEGASGRYTVRLTAEPSSDVKVAVDVPSDVPLAVEPVTLTFTADNWSTEQSVTVTVTDDADAVMHEDVELTHSVGGGGYDGVTAAPVAVTLRETTVPQMTIADATAREDAGTLAFAVTIDAVSSAEVRAAFTTGDVTATGGADYTASSGTVVFPPGTTSQTVAVPVLSDDLDEDDETFTVTLSDAENAALADGEATGTITDDDDPPVLMLHGPANAAREGQDASVAFTATLLPASGREVTVSYAALDGTAAAPGDFTAPEANAALTFAPGETSKTVRVPIIDDDLDEEDETFTVMLSDSSGATVATDAATGTITDDDDPPELGVEDVTASEDAGDLTFVVTLSAASGREVTVAYATSDGTAKQPADYAQTSGTLTIAAGDTEGTISVAVVDDAVDEEDETLTLTLSGAANATLAGGGTTLAATGTIEDDDVTPTVSVSDERVSEDAGTLSFTVTLDVASGLAATVAYATSDGTAKQPADYAQTSGTLTFAAGVTERTISVAVVDDAVDEEEEESFTVTLSAPGNAVLAGGAEQVTATGTIVDDDDPAVEVSFGAETYTASEGGSAATVAVQMNVDPEREVRIPLTVSYEGGGNGDDHSAVPSELVFTAGGELFQTFEVEAVDDAIDDDGESVVLGFGPALPEGVTAVAPEAATVTLTDDDVRGVQASPTSLSVNETDSTSYTVVLDSAPTADVTVTVTGADGTDLTAPAEGLALTFTALDWGMAQTVTVTAADDTDVLADAPVELTHTVAGGDYGANSVAGPVVTVTIVENDTATLSVMDATAAESAGYVEFTVTLSEQSSAAVTVDYATSDGTAVEPADYTETSGTLTFTAPETSKTVRVPVIDDTVDEAEAETFTLTLSNAAQAGLAGGASTLAVTGTIVDDDDPAVEVSFGAQTYTAAEGGEPVTVTVSLDRDPEREVVIPLSATPGNGAVAADVAEIPAQVRFTAGGALTRTFPLTAVDDHVDDDGETVLLEFGTLPARVMAGTTASATVTLTDDDKRGVMVSETELTIPEGKSDSYTVVLSSEPTAAVTVTVNGSDGTHLTAPSEGQGLTFTAQNWSVPHTVTVTAAADADAVVPPDVALTHTVAGGDYAAESAGSVTVRTTELTVPELALSPSAATVSESVGGAGQAFTVTLNVASSETVTVVYATSDGTAASGADYTAASETLSFAPGGALTQTFTVPILGDTLDEDDETFTLSLSDPAQATVGSGAATVTITDDDALPALNLPSGFLIANEGGGSLTVTVSLSAASGREVSVSYASSDLSGSNAATAGQDYGAVSGMLRFAPGSTTRTFSVSITDDTLDEGLWEEFNLVLSEPVNAVLGSRSQKRTRIDDDDDPPTLNLSPTAVEVAEGSAVTFTAELSAASSLPVNLTWETSNVTAVAPGDYTSSNGRVPLRIPPGETSRRFLVPTVDDALDEEDTETFGVRIRRSSSLGFDATMGDSRATVTVSDNDDPPALQMADVAAREDAGTLVVGVRLDAPSALPVTVGYAVTAGTATEGEDYTAVPAGTLTFVAGTTKQTLSVPIVDDAVHEPDETLTVTLSDPANATLADAEATGTIANDEALPVVSLGLDPSLIDENGGASTVTAALSGTSSEAVTVSVTASAVSPAVAGDLTQSGATLTISAGSTGSTGTVTITAVNNEVDAPDKSVTVSATVSGGLGVAAPAPQTLTITDDEATPAVSLTLTPSTIGENGGTSTVTATLSGLSSAAVRVEVSAEPGTGASAGDFTQSGTTLEIAADTTASTGTVTVTAEDNVLDTPDKMVAVTGTVTGGSAENPQQELLTIEDDEELGVAVSADAMTVVEGNDATFTVAVDGGTSTAPVAVTYTVAGTATAGTDYTAPSGALTLAAADASGAITIATLTDTVLDPGETLVVTLSGASTSTGAVTADLTAAQTTIGDEGMVTVTVTSGGAVVEGSPAEFEVALSGAVASAVEVGWSTADDTATAGDDYTAVASQTLTFAALSTAAQTITVATLGDALAEDDETFTVTLTVASLPGVSLGTAAATATITDDDPLTVAVTADAETVVEGSDATFTVAVAGGTSTAPVRVTYTVGGTATAGTDYTAPSGTLTLGAADSSGTITIATLDEMVLDRGETLVVTLSEASTSAGEVTADPTPAQTTISDEGTVSVSVLATAGGAVAEGSPAEFEVSLSGAVASAVEVGWSTTDGTATAGADYTAVASQTLTFAALSTAAQTITVATRGDALAENDETFTVTVTLSDPVPGVSVGTATATATITDDDPLTVAVTAAILGE